MKPLPLICKQLVRAHVSNQSLSILCANSTAKHSCTSDPTRYVWARKDAAQDKPKSRARTIVVSESASVDEDTITSSGAVGSVLNTAHNSHVCDDAGYPSS